MINATTRALSFGGRAFANYVSGRPLCVSFEVTHNCNARCKHCHLGPHLAEELATPAQYAERCREIKPVVAMVSGGEPLLRPDLEEIVRSLRCDNARRAWSSPNGALLTKQRYQPARRRRQRLHHLCSTTPTSHDKFRKIPGLFGRLDSLMRSLQGNGKHGITFSCVVQHDNYRDLVAIAERAREWNAGVNFNCYTWLRTQDKEMMVPPAEVGALRDELARLREHKRRHGVVFTSEYVLDKMADFFERGGLGGCKAGELFFVVNTDATLSPCGLIMRNYRSQAEMVEQFTRTNDCSYCYTGLRANAEKPPYWLVRDSVSRI
jgi:MoaA/NifB/PqqE/SkfB family radical SAM enzyme